LKAAIVSVFVGVIFATIFVIDQFIGPEAGEKVFPFLHYKLTLNFGFRGLWATIIISIILFTVSAFTPKTDPEKLKTTTINYSKRLEKFSGISDWRLHLLLLIIITMLIYIWLS
jgi:SSS family solute:Na+ symporter